MTTDIDITRASVYVGTYRKYNEGSIFGKWLDLSAFADRQEFYKACAVLHSDEEEPEFMFQDYENIPENLINESWISTNIFEVLEALSGMDENLLEPFLIYCDNHHHDLSKDDIDTLIGSFEDEYMGEYQSEEEFAEEDIRQNYDLSEFALRYFDYEAYARDLFCGDYWSRDGHIFRSS